MTSAAIWPNERALGSAKAMRNIWIFVNA